VLKSFARKVQQEIGGQGVVARMGGEEFAVVAATPSPEDGFALAEQIRRAIEDHTFMWRQNALRLTVSIGLSNGKATSKHLTGTFNKLLAEADEYLYRSKKAGRNCTTMAYQVIEERNATVAGV
jgi:diguanylate cyclase (GGDEF)-like protein